MIALIDVQHDFTQRVRRSVEFIMLNEAVVFASAVYGSSYGFELN